MGGRYELLAADTPGLPVPGRRALDRLTGRIVTLVTLPARARVEAASDPIVASGAGLASLRHPHLVRPIGWTFDEEDTCVVLDFADVPQPVREAAPGRSASLLLSWWAQLLRGLAHLRHVGLPAPSGLSGFSSSTAR